MSQALFILKMAAVFVSFCVLRIAEDFDWHSIESDLILLIILIGVPI